MSATQCYTSESDSAWHAPTRTHSTGQLTRLSGLLSPRALPPNAQPKIKASSHAALSLVWPQLQPARRASPANAGPNSTSKCARARRPCTKCKPRGLPPNPAHAPTPHARACPVATCHADRLQAGRMHRGSARRITDQRCRKQLPADCHASTPPTSATRACSGVRARKAPRSGTGGPCCPACPAP